VHCTKISHEFECHGQRSKVKVTGDKKNEKVWHFVQESSSGARSLCSILFGSGPRGCGPPPVLRRCENLRMLSSCIFISFFMVALCNRETIYIFMLWFVLLLSSSSFFISSPNLSRRRLDVCHTSTHGVALVRI